MPKSLTDFVQKHKTKIAKNGENDSASEENYNNIQKKRQQNPRKACPKVLRILYKTRLKQRKVIFRKGGFFPEEL